MRYFITLLVLLLTFISVTPAVSETKEFTEFYQRYLKLSYGAPKNLDFITWLYHVKHTSLKHGIDPNKTLAVLETESSKNGRLLTFGPINRSGRFVGPGGLFKGCGNWDWQQRILDPYFNTNVSIKAMTRYKDFTKSMRKYNASYNSAYMRRIKQLEHMNRSAKIFDNIELARVYNSKYK